MKSNKDEQIRDAYRVGFADAQNGVSYHEGLTRYSRKHEQDAYAQGYFAGQKKRKSYLGGEDD